MKADNLDGILSKEVERIEKIRNLSSSTYDHAKCEWL